MTPTLCEADRLLCEMAELWAEIAGAGPQEFDDADLVAHWQRRIDTLLREVAQLERGARIQLH